MSSWITILLVMAAMIAVAATVLFCIFLLPEKKAGKLPKFLKVVRDILTMKDLYLEKVLKVLYVCSTIFCIVAGLLIFFFGFGSGYHISFKWYGGYGLLLLIGGPIVLRLFYEVALMFVLLVKNTMQINAKLKSQDAPAAEKTAEPAPAEEKPPVVVVSSPE